MHKRQKEGKRRRLRAGEIGGAASFSTNNEQKQKCELSYIFHELILLFVGKTLLLIAATIRCQLQFAFVCVHRNVHMQVFMS